MITCWERVDLLTFLCVLMCFVTFSYGVSGVSIPDLSLHLYLIYKQKAVRNDCHYNIEIILEIWVSGVY